MPLLAFQTALGRLVRAPDVEDRAGAEREVIGALDVTAAERQQIAELASSAGFRVTVDIQRSWRRGRAATAARLTLAGLAPADRRDLLDEWVRTGAGTASFFGVEADQFLEFIAQRLPEPSHALTICRLEQAVHRTSSAAVGFVPPEPAWLARPGLVLRTAAHAALVWFYANPHEVLGAVEGQPLPPLSGPHAAMLFAPGLPGLCRRASARELVVWEQLANRSAALGVLLASGCSIRVIRRLVSIGAVELSGSESA